MTDHTITMPDGSPATIQWVREAPWNQHWMVTIGGHEAARYATFTEARHTVERTAGRSLGGWPL